MKSNQNTTNFLSKLTRIFQNSKKVNENHRQSIQIQQKINEKPTQSNQNQSELMKIKETLIKSNEIS